MAVDFAESKHADAWFRHPVFGDPSFDNFQRSPANPIYTGKPPLEWPVNGFLFEDPVSGNWYVYVGAYMRGYWTKDASCVPSRCILLRSKDRGRTWEELGAIWPDDLTMFDSDGKRPGHLPDVSVIYADGKYHLSYDYVQLSRRDEGIGYAVADRPEGPFVRAPKPIHSTTTQPVLFEKYKRTYAQTLFRRKNDWLVLAMMDGAKLFSWALVALTARDPAGPYGEPIFLRCVDHDTYHPALMEYYPAFVHDGFVYAPCTSVAVNRNFQMLFRAPLEAATDPAAWEIVREGSDWHSEDVPHERDGIWGQTYSGIVDHAGTLHVMFPSRDAHHTGTINLASRPWNAPLRQRGFHFSGHEGPSLTFLRHSYGGFRFEATVCLSGTGRIVLCDQPRIGPDKPKANSTLHALSLPPVGFELINGLQQIRVERDEHGQTKARIDGKEVWSGITSPGTIGLFADRYSHFEVEKFQVTGDAQPLTISYLHTDGLLGAGVDMAVWSERQEPGFRFGVGVVRNESGGRVKWNFAGTAFSLWSPRGPEGGTIEVVLDGEQIATLDLHSASAEKSRPVLSRTIRPGRHAVVVRGLTGHLFVDSLDVVV